jgi:hypothetical protein
MPHESGRVLITAATRPNVAVADAETGAILGRKASLRLRFSGFGGERVRFRILQDDHFRFSAAFMCPGLESSAIGLSDNKPSLRLGWPRRTDELVKPGEDLRASSVM